MLPCLPTTIKVQDDENVLKDNRLTVFVVFSRRKCTLVPLVSSFLEPMSFLSDARFFFSFLFLFWNSFLSIWVGMLSC